MNLKPSILSLIILILCSSSSSIQSNSKSTSTSTSTNSQLQSPSSSSWSTTSNLIPNPHPTCPAHFNPIHQSTTTTPISSSIIQKESIIETQDSICPHGPSLPKLLSFSEWKARDSHRKQYINRPHPSVSINQSPSTTDSIPITFNPNSQHHSINSNSIHNLDPHSNSSSSHQTNQTYPTSNSHSHQSNASNHQQDKQNLNTNLSDSTQSHTSSNVNSTPASSSSTTNLDPDPANLPTQSDFLDGQLSSSTSDQEKLYHPDPYTGTGTDQDPLKTLSSRTNYASFDCSASIHRSSKSSKSASSILNEKKDKYMLTPCRPHNRSKKTKSNQSSTNDQNQSDSNFVIFELCDEIEIDHVVLANYEFFSSMFKLIRITVSNSGLEGAGGIKWVDVGLFKTRNVRGIQVFPIKHLKGFYRYVRLDFLSHYGSEYFCPLSLVRIYGLTQIDAYRRDEELERRRQLELKEFEDDLQHHEEEMYPDPLSQASIFELDSNLIKPVAPSGLLRDEGLQPPAAGSEPRSSSVVVNPSLNDISQPNDELVKQGPAQADVPITPSNETSGDLAQNVNATSQHQHDDRLPGSSNDTLKPTSSDTQAARPFKNSSAPETRSNNDSVAGVVNPTPSQQASQEKVVLTSEPSKASSNESKGNKTIPVQKPILPSHDLIPLNPVTVQKDKRPVESIRNASSHSSSSPTDTRTHSSDLPINSAGPSTTYRPIVPLANPILTRTLPSSEKVGPNGSGTTTQGSESIFGQIMKRLNHLESNLDLTLKYVEEQVRLLEIWIMRLDRRFTNYDSMLKTQEAKYKKSIIEMNTMKLKLSIERNTIAHQINALNSSITFIKCFGLVQFISLLIILIFLGLTRFQHRPTIRRSKLSKPMRLNFESTSRSVPLASPSINRKTEHSRRSFLVAKQGVIPAKSRLATEPIYRRVVSPITNLKKLTPSRYLPNENQSKRLTVSGSESEDGGSENRSMSSHMDWTTECSSSAGEGNGDGLEEFKIEEKMEVPEVLIGRRKIPRRSSVSSMEPHSAVGSQSIGGSSGLGLDHQRSSVGLNLKMRSPHLMSSPSPSVSGSPSVEVTSVVVTDENHKVGSHHHHHHHPHHQKIGNTGEKSPAMSLLTPPPSKHKRTSVSSPVPSSPLIEHENSNEKADRSLPSSNRTIVARKSSRVLEKTTEGSASSSSLSPNPRGLGLHFLNTSSSLTSSSNPSLSPRQHLSSASSSSPPHLLFTSQTFNLSPSLSSSTSPHLLSPSPSPSPSPALSCSDHDETKPS